jgi:adenosine deaminase
MEGRPVGKLTGGVAALLKDAGVHIVHGWARILDGKTEAVTLPDVEPLRLQREHLLLSTGYIGVELGIALHKLGAEVAVVESTDRLLPGYDEELTRPVAASLRRLGLTLHLRCSAQGLTEDGAGVRLRSRTVAPDRCLVRLTGRRPADNGPMRPHPRVDPRRLPELLRRMPKAELHVHIEGSLEPELIFALARRNNVHLPYASVAELRSAYAFSNLQSFLDIYYAGASVLITERDFEDMARAYLERAAADNVVHAEIFFDPQTHTARGVSMATVINGLHRACSVARQEQGVDASLILCFLRHLSEEEAFETLEQALPFMGKFIGVGLDSSEVGHPPEKFARVFARCRELGLHLVAHAGEEGPPEFIWTALDLLKVERIDHGVQSLRDPALVRRLVKDRIPLTVCPLSNLKLCVFPTLGEHNIADLLDAGLMATINSDDPAYFGGYMNENFVQTFAATGLAAAEAYQLAANSFEASFIEERARRNYMEMLDGTFASFV